VYFLSRIQVLALMNFFSMAYPLATNNDMIFSMLFIAVFILPMCKVSTDRIWIKSFFYSRHTLVIPEAASSETISKIIPFWRAL